MTVNIHTDTHTLHCLVVKATVAGIGLNLIRDWSPLEFSTDK